MMAVLSEWDTMNAISCAGLLAPLTASAAPTVITAWSATSQRDEFSLNRATCQPHTQVSIL